MTPDFTNELDRYYVFVLDLEAFSPTNRVLPDGMSIHQGPMLDAICDQERRLVASVFLDSRVPLKRKLKGWREDSPIFAIENERRLIGGLYVCDLNEFDEDPLTGQAHYFFVDPAYRGKGVFSVLFQAGVLAAKSWGLKRLYVNTDRLGLPEVLARWGAVPVRTVRKRSRLGSIPLLRAHDGFLRRAMRRFVGSLRQS